MNSWDPMLLTEMKCPNCGKTFYVSTVNDYAYKFKGKMYCKWTCLTAAKRMDEKKSTDYDRCRDCVFFTNDCTNINAAIKAKRYPYSKACGKIERRTT